jgi:cysteine desulfurase/selenocysteine lyase
MDSTGNIVENMPLRTTFDIDSIRKDFPILTREVNGKPLVYLDNGATSQKPQLVIDAINKYYAYENSNIHRGVHHLSQVATDHYEQAREKLRAYINAPNAHEVLFTSGTTGGINLVASSFGRQFIGAGDEVIITTMEHHSNIVPWQMICEEKGATLKVVPINDKGEIIFEEYLKLLSEKTKMVAFAHVSNAMGTVNPAKEMIAKAQEFGAVTLVDGAQAVPHTKVDVQDLNCDFYTFSGHKMFGPTGVGILYGKEKWLEKMPPYQGGGEMIKTVTFEKTTYNELPHKFEAGTPNIAGGIGLGVAVDYINSVGLDQIEAYEHQLLEYANQKLLEIEGFRIIGTSENKASVISFLVEGTHPYDIGTILDQLGIAVRTGHHCTEPLMNWFNIPGTARASMAFYNNQEDIDRLVEGVKRAANMLK